MVLESVLVLLAAAVAAVALCRVLKLPALVGYLATGLALGPHALRVASNAEETQSLAEFGVVFLMFSIGLEFSLAKLHAMRRVVFGLGGAQVLGSMALALVAALALGLAWQTGFALGAIAAMSSTAIVSKLLAERGELDTVQGRDVIGSSRTSRWCRSSCSCPRSPSRAASGRPWWRRSARRRSRLPSSCWRGRASCVAGSAPRRARARTSSSC